MGKNGNTVEYTVGICHRGEWVKKTAKAAVASGWQPLLCGGFFSEKRVGVVREEGLVEIANAVGALSGIVDCCHRVNLGRVESGNAKLLLCD